MSPPTYRMSHDGRQWCLYRSADTVNKQTEEVTRTERGIGYFPKFHQAVARMYELAVADAVGNVSLEELQAAVATAVKVREGLTEIPDCKTCLLV